MRLDLLNILFGLTILSSCDYKLHTRSELCTLNPDDAECAAKGPANELKDKKSGVYKTNKAPSISASLSESYYNTPQTLELSASDAETKIYYTTDGSTPTVESTLYTSPIAIDSSTTVKVISLSADGGISDVATYDFHITSNLPLAAPSVLGGSFAAAQYITLTSPASGVDIYYTTDGSPPTNASTLYTGPIEIISTTTLKWFSEKATWNSSDISSETYVITVDLIPPVASNTTGTSGVSSTGFTLEWDPATDNDTVPGNLEYFVCSGASLAAINTVQKCLNATTEMAFTANALSHTISGKQPSTTYYYNVVVRDSNGNMAIYPGMVETTSAQPSNGQVDTPAFSVAAGTYTSTQSVTITTGTAGATIYYTVDGNNPTTASTEYTGAISVSSTQTVKAIAVKADWDDSTVASATYTITGQVATPTFSVAAGTYTTTQSVTISTTTAGATIYYTVDGNNPTTASTEYSGAISVSSTQTVKAIAVKADWDDSTVASATYTITGQVAAPTFSVAGGNYASTQSVELTTTTPGATIYYTIDGNNPTTASTVYSAAINVSSAMTIKAFAVKADWDDSSISSASYTFSASGSIDESFNSTGFVSTAFGAYTRAIAIGGGDEIVSVGDTTGGFSNWAVAKYDSEGQLDTSFNGSGTVSTSWGASSDEAKAVAIQSDGKVVVAGGREGETYFAIARYDVDGMLDTLFNGTGMYSESFGGTYGGQFFGVKIQNDGKIVAGGYYYNWGNGTSGIVVYRFNSDGSLDMSFNSTGISVFPTAGYTTIGDLILQSDGKILIANASDKDLIIVRFNTDGSLDTTFNGSGSIVANYGGAYHYNTPYSLGVQSDGKILVAGTCVDPFAPSFAFVARYNTNGSADATFDSDGLVELGLGNVYTMAIAANDKIVLGGHLNGVSAVARHNADGSLDTTFNGVGYLEFPNWSFINSIALQSDGKIVAGGQHISTTGFNISRIIP